MEFYTIIILISFWRSSYVLSLIGPDSQASFLACMVWIIISSNYCFKQTIINPFIFWSLRITKLILQAPSSESIPLGGASPAGVCSTPALGYFSSIIPNWKIFYIIQNCVCFLAHFFLQLSHLYIYIIIYVSEAVINFSRNTFSISFASFHIRGKLAWSC